MTGFELNTSGVGKISSINCATTTALFLNNGPIPASFSFIFGLFKPTSFQFLQQINVKKCHVHPVYNARIRTHDLWNMSLLI